MHALGEENRAGQEQTAWAPLQQSAGPSSLQLGPALVNHAYLADLGYDP